MSNDPSTSADRPSTDRPAHQHLTPSTDRPTATFPTGRWLAEQAAVERAEQAHRERLNDLWEDVTPTELLPAVGRAHEPSTPTPTPTPTACPRVSTLPEPTGGREARRTAPTGTKGLRRHLRAALAGLLIAAALLTGLQLYAAAGISSARQAALAQRDRAGSAPAVTQAPAVTPVTHVAPPATPVTPVTPASPVNTPQGNSSATQDAPSPTARPDWITADTHAAYDRTDPAASPLDLPRCTTSPDTPLPCLATISPDSKRAVVLEEDASLTALVRR